MGHKLQIIHAFALRAETFLLEHPWEAHRHEMPHLTLGFTTYPRHFACRDDLWSCLQDGWYHAEDLQELWNLDSQTVKSFDFDEWKAAHRHFLPGFHLYSGKNLVTCRGDSLAFIDLMEKDMERHYSGKNGSKYAHNFTPKMKAWVEPYALHIFQEHGVAAAVRELCKVAG